MIKLYKYFLWFYMLTKRLLCEWGFVILLCLIPLGSILINMAMSAESGVVHIVLCSEDNDPTSLRVINSLLSDNSVIQFSQSDSADEAIKAVAAHDADSAWIFTPDLSKKIDEYAAHPAIAEPVVEVVSREDSLALKIVREKLFGAVYGEFSYSIYTNFMYSDMVREQTVSPDDARNYYQSMEKSNNIIEIERFGAKTSHNNSNYLIAPIRGILSLMIVLCALTAAMYYLKEQELGKFAWLSVEKRIVPAISSCFSASCLSAIAVFITIKFSGISVGTFNELVSMILFIIATTGFCMTLTTLFRSAGKFGAVIPGIIIIMLVLSPIFFNMKVLRPVRLMLPTYYYLQSIYNTEYYLYTIIYCIATYFIGFVLNKFLAERRYQDSVII